MDTSERKQEMSDAAQYGPAETVMQLCNGYRVSQALYVAAQLQIAEHLATCCLSSADLAQATSTHPLRCVG